LPALPEPDLAEFLLQNSIFHRLSNLLWGLIVTATVMLAIYVSVGRLVASNVSHYEEAILAELNSRVPFDVEADQVAGEWQSFSPRIVLSGLRVTLPGMEQQPLALTRGRIGLDVLESLRTRSLQATQVELEGLSLSGELDENGRLRLTGFAGGQAELGQWVRAFLLNIERIALSENTLALALPGGETRTLDLDLELRRRGSQRYLDARLLSTAGAEIRVLGEGLGDPFHPEAFRGELYLDVDSSDLGAMRQLIAGDAPPLWADGTVNLEAWLDWDRGKVGVESRIEADQLAVYPKDRSWELAIDRVAMEARLVERRNRRTLFVSDLEVADGGHRVTLPRLQLDLWGQALRLRAEQVDLAPVNDLATSLALMPTALVEGLDTLRPRGTLDSLQLNIGNLSSPGRDWELAANFSDVEADSWKGAPGVASATGYVELSDGGGFVVLDSRPFSMTFPTVYNEPLAYEDFHGTIHIEWDRLGLQLSSGLVTAAGPEGTARALFGLDVPFQQTPVGIEMDLLVGLQDTRPVYRAKYLPYILNPGLLEWLGDSVGEGEISQAGFVWRGSLRGGAKQMRTIQLALELDRTRLDYHPQWPAVDDINGILYVDDTDVSVWSESARLGDTVVERLSAEAWLDDASGQMMLAIDSILRGTAADGLAVLNGSMLREYVGDAFADWRLDGGLDTHLKLLINIAGDPAPPQVDVTTHWRGVDIDVLPGNLPVRGVSGVFAYSSGAGFSSDALAGTLWGESLEVAVSQGGGALAQGRETPPVEVAMATTVDMADLRQWLDLDLLRFARGRSAVDLVVTVAPGRPPQLLASSSLVGVALDLPPPWQTSAEEQRSLVARMPLGGERSEIDLQLEGGIHLSLALEDGAMRGGALAINRTAIMDESRDFRVSGSAPLLDVDAWGRFLGEYFALQLPGDADRAAPVVAEPAAGPAPGGDSGGDEEGETAALPPVRIEGFHAERLLVAGREFRDVMIALEQTGGEWRLSAATGWLEGALFIPDGDEVFRVELQRLNLVGLEGMDLSPAEEGPAPEWPDVDVTILDLHSGERQLGELAFQLRSRDAGLVAGNITGELAGLRVESRAPGELRWNPGEEEVTALEVRLAFDDLGATLHRLGYQHVLQTESGVIDLALDWPGGPRDFSLQTGRGSLRINTLEGSFLEAPAGASGALRVVGILDLASIVQRLSLSHMFESGIPFDTLEGEVYLHGGTIEVPRVDVRGASSRFQFSGVSEVANRSLDGELVATLPVASNLPWVAALAGGLPVAAGVFVVSKVFEKQFDVLSSAVYRLEGSWDDPQVSFDRIWDDGSGRLAPEEAVSDPQQPGAVPGISGIDFAPDPQAVQP
jgi:uncharacterized protein (TIGR02099 family)